MGKKKQKNPDAVLTFGKAAAYSLGIFGIQGLIGMMSCYQSQFYTSVFKADLRICAIIILCAKIISCVSDPIIGSIIDKSHFKSGKMKPFVAMSALPFAFITTIMFVNISFPNSILMYIYITVTTVLWNIAMSFADIPSQGMLAMLSPHSSERETAAGYSNALKSLALVVPNGVVPIACLLMGTEAITPRVYTLTAVLVGVFALVCYAVMLKSSKEVVKSAPSGSMSMKVMFNELKNNKMLIIVFLIYMLGFGRNIAATIGVQTAAVVFDDFELTIGAFTIKLAGENLPMALGLGCMIPSTLSVLLAPLVSKKIGPKKTYLYFGLYGTVTSVISYLLFVFGGDFFRGFWGIFILQFVMGFMFGTHYYIPLVMVSDIVDYREMQTGKRTEGLQFSVLSLAIKLSNALCVATGIFIVGLSGYKGGMLFAEVTARMQNIVMVAYWLLPGISLALSCIPVFFYKINEKTKAQYREYAAKRDESVV